jgi:hypothetical protein
MLNRHLALRPVLPYWDALSDSYCVCSRFGPSACLRKQTFANSKPRAEDDASAAQHQPRHGFVLFVAHYLLLPRRLFVDVSFQYIV